MNIIEDSELNYAEYLLKNGFIQEPKNCKCGKTSFFIQYDGNSKTSKCIFRCKNYHCKNRIPIRVNSFFAEYPKLKLKLVTEIIKGFMSENNAKATFNYLKDQLKIEISLEKVQSVYHSIRKVIAKYYDIIYQSEILGEENENGFYSVDESDFCNDLDGNKQWVLGIINNFNKDFRIEISKNRNSDTLRSFICKYVHKGITIVSD